MPPSLTPEQIEAVWRNFLTAGDERAPARVLVKRKQLFRFFHRLPAAPRCRMCQAPFKGPGGQLVRLLFDRGPSKLNPMMCNYCDKFAATYQGGAEVPLSVLFADMRGSTTLAEGMAPRDFSQVVNRFYNAATALAAHLATDALESRELQLKGRAEPVTAWVVPA